MKITNHRIILSTLIAVASLSVNNRLAAQPGPPPNSPDLPCGTEPPANFTDTLASTLDDEGFFSLFNGKDFKGMAQTCASGHTSNKSKGGIFRVDTALKAIFTASRDANGNPATSGGDGGLLVVRQKKITNYEIIFDAWPGFLNDGGLFNRTTWNGGCYQTVLDYTDGNGSWLGSYCENCIGGTTDDLRPFGFNGTGSDPKNITIPGNSRGANWTLITKASNPTTYGCAAGGCVQTDWVRLWNFSGWNQNRVKFYKGNTAGAKVIMKSFFRKTATDPWVPVLSDSSGTGFIQPGYIAFQVHGNGRFRNPKGTWYRNIRWRPLDENGDPIYKVTALNPKKLGHSKLPFTIVGGTLNGSIGEKHELIFRDLNGSVVEKFSGQAGNFSYPIKSGAKKWVALEVKTAKGIEYYEVSHLK